MVNSDKTLSPQELNLLVDLKGAVLETIDACIVARGDMAWNTVRLHFGTRSVDINNRLGEITVDELGTVDEFGLMSVSRAENTTLNVPEASPETSVIPVDQQVVGVSVVNSRIDVYGNGKLVARITYPQAILLNLKDEWLVLDKETWFDETIAIKSGANPARLVYDDSGNWADDPEEDPTTHYEVSSETIEL